MKALNYFEIHAVVDAVKERLPAQLQEISGADFGLGLAMYSRAGKRGSDGNPTESEKSWWLFLDLTAVRPGLFFANDRGAWPSKKKTTPVGLFLNSHAKGMVLKDIDVLGEFGRIIQLVFSNSLKEVVVEFEVIPRSPNVIVHTSDGKKISWFKPRERKEMQNPEVDEARSVSQIIKEWEDAMTGTRRSSGAEAKGDLLAGFLKQRNRDLEKKRKALSEIEKTLNSNEDQTWFELGELLKWKSLKELEPQWQSFIDTKLNQQENRERAFAKGKQLQTKKEGTLKRRNILIQEILHLESGTPDDTSPGEPKSKIPKIKDTKLRTLTLSSGFVAHMGKSAQDNMKLLRQSQPWDFWIHLRDYPSSHAILHRNKNQTIPHKDIEEVAGWLASASLGQKQILAGQRIDVMYAECRFVKPIKGDKLGRVNYQNEKTITVRLQK